MQTVLIGVIIKVLEQLNIISLSEKPRALNEHNACFVSSFVFYKRKGVEYANNIIA